MSTFKYELKMALVFIGLVAGAFDLVLIGILMVEHLPKW